MGGTCLNVGCIPSKAIIHVAEAFHNARSPERNSAFGLTIGEASLDLGKTMAWKDTIVGRLNAGVASLLRKNNVTVLIGKATIEDGKTCIVSCADGPVRVRTEHLVIATGSSPAEIAALPFGGSILSSTDALSLNSVPDRLVVIGAGYIGLELGIAFSKLGSTVTIVEASDRILPAWDADLTRPVARRLKSLGIEILTGSKASGFSNGILLATKTDSGEVLSIPAEKILVAVGRIPRTEGFGLERLDLTRNGPFIDIDNRCATSMRNVWAIGDVTGEPMLAHRAMSQGETVAEIIAGKRRVHDKNAMPSVCFTDPEIASVGITVEAAHLAGVETTVGTFPFSANGRSMTQTDEAGFIRVVCRADNHRVLGIQAVGAHVSELAAAFALAIEMDARAEDIAATIHAHPTRGEAFQEAALAALGHPLHI